MQQPKFPLLKKGASKNAFLQRKIFHVFCTHFFFASLQTFWVMAGAGSMCACGRGSAIGVDELYIFLSITLFYDNYECE